MKLINYLKLWLGRFWRLEAAVFIGFMLIGALLTVFNARAGTFEDFFKAVQLDRVEVVNQMLLNGMDPNSFDAAGTPAIVLAAQNRADKVVKLLANHRKIRLDEAGAASETALMVAIYFSNKEQTALLLSKGAEVNRVGWTPLHYAASTGNVELIKQLLEKAAYIDAQSPSKTTPLMMAARERKYDVVKLLLDEGADPTTINDAGFGAAEYCDRNKESALAAEIRQRADAFRRKYIAPLGQSAAPNPLVPMQPLSVPKTPSAAPDTKAEPK